MAGAGIENAPIPDSRPPDAGGVTPEDLVGQQTALAAVLASIVDLQAAIASTQATIDAMSSWATVLAGLANLVEVIAPIIGKVLATGTPTTTTTTTGGTTPVDLMNALQKLLSVPVNQRAETALNILLPLLLK